MFEAIVPCVETENGRMVLPVDLGFTAADRSRGLPRKTEKPDFMKRLQALSAKYGTQIREENGKYFVTL